jgi:hypothetical protein
MAKKNFKSGMDMLLQGSKDNIQADNKGLEPNNEKSKEKCCTKATYYFDTDRLKSIKAIAYFDRRTIGEVLDEALEKYLHDYEQLEYAISQYAKRYPEQ